MMLAGVNQLDINNLPPILLLFGEEEFLIDEALTYITEKIIPKVSDPSDRDMLSPDNADLNRILEAVRSFPFLSQKRCVIVRNFEKYFSNAASSKNGAKTPFGHYLLSPQPSTFLVLTGEIPALKGVSKSKKIPDKFPYNILLEKHTWIEYRKVWESNFPAWIKSHLKQTGLTISDDAVQMIISNCNPTLRDIKNELDKLTIYTEGKNAVTADDVTRSIGVSRQYNVFELQKAIEHFDLAKSIFILQNILSSGSSEMLILSILTRFFTALWKLSDSEAITMQNKNTIAKSIGVSPFFINDYVAALKLFGIRRVDRAFSLLCEADRAIKTGQCDGKTAMETLIVQLLS